jgi:hypothetical protein
VNELLIAQVLLALVPVPDKLETIYVPAGIVPPLILCPTTIPAPLGVLVTVNVVNATLPVNVTAVALAIDPVKLAVPVV